MQDGVEQRHCEMEWSGALRNGVEQRQCKMEWSSASKRWSRDIAEWMGAASSMDGLEYRRQTKDKEAGPKKISVKKWGKCENGEW